MGNETTNIKHIKPPSPIPKPFLDTTMVKLVLQSLNKTLEPVM